MTALAIERWHACPGAEILLPDLPAKLREQLGRILLMAGGKSDYWEAKVKNLVLGAVAFTAPTNVYFGLWVGANPLTDASVGNTAGEVTGGAYDRVTVANNTTNFATVTTGAKVNSTAIAFPAATANWGTVTALGVFDGNLKTAADNLLVWADLTTAKAVNSGDTAQFAINDFSYTED